MARWAATLALIQAGCAEHALQVPQPPEPALRVGIELSAVTGRPGERIAVAIRTAEGGPALKGLQGALVFDAARLRFVGQAGSPGTLVMINDSRAGLGQLRVLSVELGRAALAARTAVLVFELEAAGQPPAPRYALEVAATPELTAIRRAGSPEAVVATDLEPPASARRWTLAEWTAALGGRAAGATPRRVPGQYVPNLRYGDATLDGLVDVLDVAQTANVAVGNDPLLTDAARDYVIAANVAPANLPGLGEAGDAQPPGDEGGVFTIDVLDAAAIGSEAVGTDAPVAGELIPGREPRPTTRVTLTGVLTADRLLTRDTIYELLDSVIVAGGVTLTIQPGTLVEGDVASSGYLAVYRGANIVARGTRLEPIVFTCNAAIKSRGCWGGLVINGFSLLNNGEILPGGVDVNGCPQKIYPTSPGYGGGCLVQDTSGILRYVRIEYAGHPRAGFGPVAGLSLLGVGSGTVVESVQVHESVGDGLFIGGGTVDLRNIVLTDNAGDGLRWEDGWVGRAQFVIVQQSVDNDHAIHGVNFALNPGAGPRSNPALFHVTISGPPGGLGAGGDAVRLEHGSALTLKDAIVLRAGVAGLDIDGAESCAQAAAALPGIHVAASIFFASPEDLSADADCVDEAAYAAAPARANRLLDPQLLAPFNTLTPDLRPAVGSPATGGFVLAPADGFFDTGAMHVGAVPAANATGTTIPWYAGWTRGW